MPKIAIDIVIIPPEKIIKTVLKINKRALDRGDATIELSKDKRIPHLSLLMGIMDEENLEKIKKEMQEIVENFEPTELEGKINKNNCLMIEPNVNLQKLHETIIAEVDPLLTHEVTTDDMFLEKPGYKLTEGCHHFPNKFIEEHSFQKFWPHISIHSPEENPPELPLKFTASRLAICHLGDHCSCRKILAEFRLK